LPKRYGELFADLREAQAIGRRGDPTARREQKRYATMQASIPEGARVVVMLDDPAFLDFGRNSIANLDTPGFASPGTQLPTFRGAEPVRAYFVDHGYRYLAFVREDHSRYFFRRGFWLWRLFNDGEFFQLMSAYELDAIESFAELATTTKVLHDEDGLVVLDLATVIKPASERPAIADEPLRRSTWLRDLAQREGLQDAWSLINRNDLRFEDGVAGLQFVDAGVDDQAWFEVTHPHEREPMRGTPIRGLFRRAHLRVRGSSSMRLVLRAAISRKSTFTRPRLDVSLDGELLASAIADDDGRYVIDVVVPRDALGEGWHDVYLVFSSVVEPDKDVRDPRVSRLVSVEWTAVP
jgi:hypothetical protein